MQAGMVATIAASHLASTRLPAPVVAAPGKALRANITTLGPKVLPLSEIAVFAGNLIARKVLRLRGVPPYVPDFQEAAQHICIHTGNYIHPCYICS